MNELEEKQQVHMGLGYRFMLAFVLCKITMIREVFIVGE